MNPTKRNYRATFILDNTGKEDTIEQIIEGVKTEIAAIQGEITAVENLGKKDFARVTDAIAGLRVRVEQAYVSTLGHEVVDTFYVTSPDGTKLTDPDVVAALEQALLTALSKGPGPSSD